MIKIGKAAEEQALTEKKDYSKNLNKFKSGSVIRVKVPNGETFAQYFAHGVYGSFYTTLHTDDDFYCVASKHFYDEAKNEKDEKKAKDIQNKGYELSKKERYMFGFYDLSTGKEMVIDITKNQAVALIKQIKKYNGKYEKFAFTIEKSGSGQSTVVSLDPIIDDDDLTSQEKKNFEECKTKTFDLQNFTEMFSSRTHKEQIEDLEKYGLTKKEFTLLNIKVEDDAPVEPPENTDTSADESVADGTPEDDSSTEEKHDF